MRSLRKMLTRHSAALQQGVPPPITPAEKSELERATVRIEKKWSVFDRMVEDYKEQDLLRTKLVRRIEHL